MRMAPVCGALLALLIPACDGGTTTALETAALQGTIYELDGQTVDRSGVLVTLVETGEMVVTQPDGAFTFADLAVGTYTLDFESTRRLAAEEPGEGKEADEYEDEEGRPKVEVTPDCGEIEIRVALEDGKVRDYSWGEPTGRHAMESMFLPEGAEFELAGKIKISTSEERELFKVQVWPLEPGTVIDVLIDDREGDGALRVGSAIADAAGEATFLRDTGDGDELPFGVEGVAALEGFRVDVRISEDLVLIGEVPDLPEESDGEEEPKEEPKPLPEEGDHLGKALLEAWIDGIEGVVEVRCWPREEIQRFRMVIGGLEVEDHVLFEIEHPEGEGWVRLGTRYANGDGIARIDTDNDLEMPFGVESVKELVGLKVRIRRFEKTNDDVIMDGVVPELVRA